jgi:DNA-binding LytR/AlgR family response regulator
VFRVAICDCDQANNTELANILNSISIEEGLEIIIDVYKTYDDLKKHIFDTKYDLLFLEICNQGFSGIELIKRLKNNSKELNMDIIFVSRNEAQALASFEVFPIGYLVKPYNKRKVRLPLHFAYEKLCGIKSVVFKAIEGGSVATLVDELLYIEVIGNELDVHTFHGGYGCVGALSEVCTHLPQGQFYRSHRSSIVNLKHVAKINKFYFIMCNGHKVTIAKNRYAQAKEIFSKYIG